VAGGLPRAAQPPTPNIAAAKRISAAASRPWRQGRAPTKQSQRPGKSRTASRFVMSAQLSNSHAPKHTWTVSAHDSRSLPLSGALALLALAAALMLGLREGLAALHAYGRSVSLARAEQQVVGDLLSLTLVQLVAMGTALALGLRFCEPETGLREALSLHPVRKTSLALCLAAGACLQFPLTELSNVLHAEIFGPDPLAQQLALQNLLEAHSLARGLLIVGCLAGAIPLIEELLFRGLFLFGLSARYGRPAGVFFSAVLFGAVHLSWVPVLYATTAGLVLGWLALSTRSIWPGVALHGAFNAVPILLPEHVLPLRGFNVPSEAAEHLPALLIWPPLLAAFALLAAVRRLEAARRAGPRASTPHPSTRESNDE
jgi:membrane protease YdiL (CAAX protease family)